MAPGLIELTQEALQLVLRLSVPVVGIALVVGLITSLLQAATQIHDVAVGHLPRFVAVAVALTLLGPWLGSQLVDFAVRGFSFR